MSLFGAIGNWLSGKFSAAGWTYSVHNMGRAVWSQRNYESFAKEGYQKNVVAYSCVRRMAVTAASVPLYIMDGDKEVEEHPLMDLLNAPNPFQDYTDFAEAWVSYLMLSGNAYIEKVDSLTKKATAPFAGRMGAMLPQELYALRSDRMRIVPGARGWPAAYEYVVGGNVQKYEIDVARRLMPVLHVKTFHPTDDWYGLSPIEAAAMSVDTHTAATEWNTSLLQNSASIPGIFRSTKTALTKDQRQELREELRKHSGPKNIGEPMIADGDWEFFPMGFSPKDMEFINAKNTSARDICLAFATPPQLLGIPGDNTYSNLKEANIAYARGGVIPVLRKYVGGLNRWLSPLYGDKIKICYDEDVIPGLAEERVETYAKLEATTFLRLDEKRAAVGYEDYDGGDESKPGSFIMVGSGMIKLEDAVADPEPVDPALDPNADPEDVGDIDPDAEDGEPADGDKPPSKKPGDKKPQPKPTSEEDS